MRKATVILVLCVACLWADVPNEITYQGRLREYGQPVNGTRTMRFSVYDAATNGTQRWTSGDVSVTVSSGAFSCTLSPTTVDWRGKDYWIETIISGKVLSPREKITTQAFALHSQTAESITRSSGDIKFEIGVTSYVVVNSGGLRLNSGAITFPDGSMMSSMGSGSAMAISNNSDAVMTADADANSSGKIQFNIGGVEKMSVQNDGKVGMGTTNPSSQLHIARENACNLTIQEFSQDSVGPGIVPEKCRNTQIVPNPIQANDILFHVSPAPYINAANRDIGSHIKIIAESNPSGNYVPTKIELCTSSSTANATPKVTIISDGNVGIGTTAPDAKLRVEGEAKSLVNGTTFYMVPRGTIIMWSGSTIPSGWWPCDGTNGTPDLRGRFIAGYDSGDSDYNSIAKTGGEKTHTLNVVEMPTHGHTATCATDGSHSHSFNVYNGAGGTDYLKSEWTGTTKSLAIGPNGDHSHSVSIGNQGNGGAHENRPPFFVLCYLMKL